MTDTTPLAEQRCPNCGSTELRQDSDGVWHCEYCRSTFRADDPAMIVVSSPNVQQANENVVDTADLLTYDQQQAVSAHLRALRDRSDIVVVVETVNTITENVEHYARRRAQELGIGDDAKDNGILILMVRQPRRVQVQTGNGIAPHLGPEDVERIVKESFVPAFQAGDLVAGLTGGADALVAAYQDNRATGVVRPLRRTPASPSSGPSPRSAGTWRSRYLPISSGSSGSRGGGSGSPLARVLGTVVIIVVIWVLVSSLSGRSPLGFLGGGGGGSSDYSDSGYDGGSDWDSGSWDSGGGFDSGGGSDYGGGDFDSGSGGGSDW